MVKEVAMKAVLQLGELVAFQRARAEIQGDSLVDTVDGRTPRSRQGHRRPDLKARRLRPCKVDAFELSNDLNFEASRAGFQ